MSRHTWGWEADPRRDGCDQCTDLLGTLEELRDELESQSRSLSATIRILLATRAELAAARAALAVSHDQGGRPND